MLKVVLAVLSALALLQTPVQPPAQRRVAITIDDGPVVNEMRDLGSFQRISKGLIEALKSEKVPATIFINERQINVPGQRDGRAAVLEQWLDAGFDLGNHTYSHPSLNRVPLWQFADDVVKGEVIIRPLIEQRGRKLVWFRYPFLHSGTTADIHQGIVDFLEQHQYRVAPVTVDYADYTFAGVHRNQLARGASETAARVREAYLDQVDVGFDYAEKASVELFGREPAQILLIHCNELNSITLRETIARLRKRGYAFITLDEAMQDPVYQRPDTFTGPGGSWLSRTASAMGKQILSASNPRVPDWIAGLSGGSRPTGAAPAQEEVTFDGRPARILDNDKLTLTIRSVGGAMVQLLMKDDASKLNPLDGLGHFVCVDGFGPVSDEERAAGMRGHGEAHRARWDLVSADKTDGTSTIRFTANLPLVEEVFRRTLRIVDGENVVYVDSELESLLGFDRPVNWAEHATIGGPFLEQGKTVTEMSATRAMTRSHASEAADPPEQHQLADFKEFTWPMAPKIGGGRLDMRTAPVATPIMDQTASLMDPSRRLAFVTAFHPEKHALFGYVFRREEYPWIQIWDSYPGGSRRSYRGLEFASQPFDLPRRDVIQTGSMFGTPTYRWLPARATIASGFLMFYTRTPDGFRKVDDVVLADGRLTIEDRRARKKIVLVASRGL